MSLAYWVAYVTCLLGYLCLYGYLNLKWLELGHGLLHRLSWDMVKVHIYVTCLLGRLRYLPIGSPMSLAYWVAYVTCLLGRLCLYGYLNLKWLEFRHGLLHRLKWVGDRVHIYVTCLLGRLRYLPIGSPTLLA